MCGFGKSKKKKSNSKTDLKTAYALAIAEAKEKKEQEKLEKEIAKDNARILAEEKKEQEMLEKAKSKARKKSGVDDGLEGKKKRSIFAKRKSSGKRKISDGAGLEKKKGSEEKEGKEGGGKKSGGEELKRKKSDGAGILDPVPAGPGTTTPSRNPERNRRQEASGAPREGSLLQSSRRRPGGSRSHGRSRSPGGSPGGGSRRNPKDNPDGGSPGSRRNPKDYPADGGHRGYNYVHPEAPSLNRRSQTPGGGGGGHSPRSPSRNPNRGPSRSHSSRSHSRHSSRSRAPPTTPPPPRSGGTGGSSRYGSSRSGRHRRRPPPDRDRVEKVRHEPNQPYDVSRYARYPETVGRYERNDPDRHQGRNERNQQTVVPVHGTGNVSTPRAGNAPPTAGGAGNVRDADQLERDRLNERYGHPPAHHETRRHHSRHIDNMAPRLQTRDIHAGQVSPPPRSSPDRPVELNPPRNTRRPY